MPHCNKILSFLEGHSKFPAQSLKTFVSDTGKIYTLSKAFFLRLLSGKLFHSGECAFFHVQKSNSPALCFKKQFNGKFLAREWEKDFTILAPHPPPHPACPALTDSVEHQLPF